MNYGLCNLNIVPLRIEDSDCSEMVSQVLYGDLFEVLELSEQWCKVRLVDDQYEGWIDSKQYKKISPSEFQELSQKPPMLTTHLLDIITTTNNTHLPISIGSNTAISKKAKSPSILSLKVTDNPFCACCEASRGISISISLNNI